MESILLANMSAARSRYDSVVLCPPARLGKCTTKTCSVSSPRTARWAYSMSRVRRCPSTFGMRTPSLCSIRHVRLLYKRATSTPRASGESVITYLYSAPRSMLLRVSVCITLSFSTSTSPTISGSRHSSPLPPVCSITRPTSLTFLQNLEKVQWRSDSGRNSLSFFKVS